MKPIDLTIHAQTDAEEATVIVKSIANWKKIEIRGWRYGVSQSTPGVMLLAPSDPSSPLILPGFELPQDGVGNMSLEIKVNEPIWVSGNDDRLVVSSSKMGEFRGIIIHCIPSSKAALVESFQLLPKNSPAPSAAKTWGKKWWEFWK